MEKVEYTQMVGHIEFKPNVVKPGDLIVYLVPKRFSWQRARKQYGIVTKVNTKCIYIYTSTNPAYLPDTFKLSPTDNNIIAIYRNGEEWSYDSESKTL